MNRSELKVGQTVQFMYNGKLRMVKVEKVVWNREKSYINGPQLNDNNQVKSFTIANMTMVTRVG